MVKLIEYMVEKHGGYEKRVLIFCDKKLEVDSLSKNLNIPNQPLHGDVAQYKRERAYRDFKVGMLKCIVATNVAARGLDFPHVDLVIQMAPPINTEEYIHRSGRTGRAGK
jgi:superfamily II DNA/RNA helicase